MGLIEQAKAAYVAGRIAIDELERQIEDALRSPEHGIYGPPSWLVEWQRTISAQSNAQRAIVLTRGATFTAAQRGSFIGDTDAPSGFIEL